MNGVATTLPPAPLEPMRQAFAAALAGGAAAGVHDDAYAFGGRAVRLRVVGARLAERTARPFAHLRADVSNGGRTLRIDLWDETDTGVRCPLDATADLGQRFIACGGTLSASTDGRYVSFEYQDSVTVLDRHTERIIGCRRSGSHLSRGECSKPFVVLLSIWYHDRGVQMMHAGLVARGGAGVLVPGASGTGKSTTSLASVSQGLEFLADDFVGIEPVADGSFLGHSVYGTACLARQDLHRFPAIERHAVDDVFPEEEKPIMFLPELFPDRLRRTVAVRAVALLRVGAERTAIRPATRPEALREFAASTLHTVVPRPGRAALQLIAGIVQRVPAYWLALGPELDDVAPSLDAILSHAGA